MPRYDFRCHDCTTVFEVRRPMAQASAPAGCPTCGSQDTTKLLSSIAILNNSPQTKAAPVTNNGGGCGCGSCSCGH